MRGERTPDDLGISSDIHLPLMVRLVIAGVKHRSVQDAIRARCTGRAWRTSIDVDVSALDGIVHHSVTRAPSSASTPPTYCTGVSPYLKHQLPMYATIAKQCSRPPRHARRLPKRSRIRVLERLQSACFLAEAEHGRLLVNRHLTWSQYVTLFISLHCILRQTHKRMGVRNRKRVPYVPARIVRAVLHSNGPICDFGCAVASDLVKISADEPHICDCGVRVRCLSHIHDSMPLVALSRQCMGRPELLSMHYCLA